MSETNEASKPAICSCCRERVTGYALDYGRRLGVFRCGATHCKKADTALMRALRELSSVPPQVTEARVALLERTLRERGIEVPQ